MRKGNKNHVVMIVDDDLFIRKSLGSIFSNLADIVEAADGAEVIGLYKKHNPDIVFLDINLPNISGMDLIYEIKSIDDDPYIITVSVDNTDANVSESSRRGSKGFLSKPFAKKQVLYFFNACPTVKASKPSQAAQ
jgi:CheY-like chemotaxis protein